MDASATGKLEDLQSGNPLQAQAKGSSIKRYSLGSKASSWVSLGEAESLPDEEVRRVQVEIGVDRVTRQLMEECSTTPH